MTRLIRSHPTETPQRLRRGASISRVDITANTAPGSSRRTFQSAADAFSPAGLKAPLTMPRRADLEPGHAASSASWAFDPLRVFPGRRVNCDSGPQSGASRSNYRINFSGDGMTFLSSDTYTEGPTLRPRTSWQRRTAAPEGARPRPDRPAAARMPRVTRGCALGRFRRRVTGAHGGGGLGRRWHPRLREVRASLRRRSRRRPTGNCSMRKPRRDAQHAEVE